MTLHDKIAAGQLAKADRVPTPFRTVEEWAEEWGRSSCNAARTLKRGEAMGLVAAKAFMIPVGGRLRSVMHYADKEELAAPPKKAATTPARKPTRRGGR